MQSNAVKTKNRNKKIRVIIQLIILVVLAVFIYIKLYHGEFRATKADRTEDKFIALSYIGVQKYDSDSTTRISQGRLNEHMDALEAMGYTTITQEDITHLYQKGELLPEKSVFLMFEDGRKDTGVLAHEVLKDHNYIASMMTYAEKYEQTDNRFLTSRDMKILMDTTFWEHGSNGYRLEYINVFDRYKNFFGHIDSNVYNTVTSYIERDYNHYLMDYIRDADRMPTETYEEMEERITGDYKSMVYIYEEHMDKVPSFYALMHSNTSQFGTDDDTSAVNEKNIRETFAVNFNREGFSQNTAESSVYDLTRMQPQSNWYSNHLIMRIVDDTGEEPVFVIGDEDEAANWNVLMGAAEYRTNTIVVTSEPNSHGIIALEQDMNNSIIDVTLEGNLAGVQKVVFKESADGEDALELVVDYNYVYVNNISGDDTGNVFELSLKEFDSIPLVSKEEDEAEGLGTYSNSVVQYEKKYEMLQNAALIQEDLKEMEIKSVEDGAEEYEAIIGVNERGSRKISIELVGHNLSLSIDGKTVIKNLNLNRELDYQVLSLEASAVSDVQEQYSQRNIVDDVYDAVFTDLRITEVTSGNTKYSYVLEGWDKFADSARLLFEKVTTIVMEIF